jgi:hypothetical protein
MQNQRFWAKSQEQEVERKNSKSEPIRGVCGHKITRRKVTHTTPMRDPYKKIPTKTLSNLTNGKSTKKTPKIHKKKNGMGLERNSRLAHQIFSTYQGKILYKLGLASSLHPTHLKVENKKWRDLLLSTLQHEALG